MAASQHHRGISRQGGQPGGETSVMPAYDTGCADVLFAHGPVITALLWFGPAAMGTSTHRRRSGDQPDHHGGTQPCTQPTDAQPHDPSAASGEAFSDPAVAHTEMVVELDTPVGP